MLGMDMDMDPKGSDPSRLEKGGSHMIYAEEESVEEQPMEKPASVKAGGGRNVYSPGKDTSPGFEGMESYKSVNKSGQGFGQGQYPPASKQSQPSIGTKHD